MSYERLLVLEYMMTGGVKLRAGFVVSRWHTVNTQWVNTYFWRCWPVLTPVSAGVETPVLTPILGVLVRQL